MKSLYKIIALVVAIIFILCIGFGAYYARQDHEGADRHCGEQDFSNYTADGQETTLRQVLFIHRHGDRTSITFPPLDPIGNDSFVKFHGYGQLTNEGKTRSYTLGKLLRQRYEKFVNNSVNKNMVLSRSSGVPRCVESAQLFLSAFLPLNKPDSPDAEALVWNSGCDELGDIWQPASIRSMGVPIDGMLAEASICNSLMQEYANTIEKSYFVQSVHREYMNEAKILEEVLGYKADSFYEWISAASYLATERDYFQESMESRILDIYDRVQEAGRLCLLAYQSTVTARRLRSGLLVNDLIQNMKKARQQIQAGEEKVKIIQYSSHDLNIFSLLGVLENVDRFPFPPNFGATIILELHEEADEWFIKFFYMPSVPSALYEMHLDSCESGHPNKRCLLDKFEEIMYPYSIKSWSQWMKECNNDIYAIDPYQTAIF